jgi:hypothetical protein
MNHANSVYLLWRFFLVGQIYGVGWDCRAKMIVRARLLAQLRRPNHRLHLELCAYYFALSTPSPINLARRVRPTLVSRWAAAGCAMSGVQGGSLKNGARGVERKESLAPTRHMQHSRATLPTPPNIIQTYISMQRAKIDGIQNIFKLKCYQLESVRVLIFTGFY